MNAKVKIYKCTTSYFAEIEIQSDFIYKTPLETAFHKSKGELKRKVIQFCSELGLQIEWV